MAEPAKPKAKTTEPKTKAVKKPAKAKRNRPRKTTAKATSPAKEPAKRANIAAAKPNSGPAVPCAGKSRSIPIPAKDGAA